MRSLNQFGCCTLKPNTFPMRTTGGGTSSNLPMLILDVMFQNDTFTLEKNKKHKKKTLKKTKKIKHKNRYLYSAGYDVNGTIAEKERTF